jgi:hypothetical protein
MRSPRTFAVVLVISLAALAARAEVAPPKSAVKSQPGKFDLALTKPAAQRVNIKLKSRIPPQKNVPPALTAAQRQALLAQAKQVYAAPPQVSLAGPQVGHVVSTGPMVLTGAKPNVAGRARIAYFSTWVLYDQPTDPSPTRILMMADASYLVFQFAVLSPHLVDCRFAAAQGATGPASFRAFTGDRHLEGPLQEGHALFVASPTGKLDLDPSLLLTGSGAEGASLIDCTLTPVQPG